MNFLTDNLVQILWIVGLAFGGRAVIRILGAKILRLADDGDDARESGKEKRAKTLIGLLHTTGNIIIFGVILVMTMQLFGVNTAPILAGAGVIGFGIGFGTQTLVKDFISGILIVTENQFAVGDKVKIGTFEGKVCKMSVRTTVLCDNDGNLIFLPNGSIANVINYSLCAKEKSKTEEVHAPQEHRNTDAAT